MMDFIIKFAQAHESFRIPEIEALAIVENVHLKIIHYDEASPLCIVKLPCVDAAKRLVRRSIMAQSIHELWGSGKDLEELNKSVETTSSPAWPKYKTSSFKFVFDSYQGSRSKPSRLSVINNFRFLPFEGPIIMKNPDEVFTILEIWPWNSVPMGIENPDYYHLGRFIANSAREVVLKFDLKKRQYISTTSMDSELALITANIALAAPGKIFYDPFVGTGSFPIACAHFGAMSWGSDIDGRSIRGEGNDKSLKGNFGQYDIESLLGDVFAADITNSPIRRRRIWDGIVCDPPYGVREGLRVLGLKDPEKTPWLVERGIKHGMEFDYVPPKKPYSFMAILDDILVFAVETLVDNGRLSFWMPTANEEDQQIAAPTHPGLQIVANCGPDG
ncbi:RNA methylase family protein [Cordyceps fumosorosea ARSEF 2679]|uniref:tRNA (guanine(10)-N(2))-methyltransferase n=1 Tax=Cordyceps fumosorosea (strain ARSEF 2679) TaxID=1081104 RepID=A0A167LFY9_CORFA|nr:RNA methylase family protein [Cordyceps fumosorosea ARSEF 2679]OAA53042.1 RNA methylase family protein [Cordyceps fumosorosea ARSEF 2679]